MSSAIHSSRGNNPTTNTLRVGEGKEVLQRSWDGVHTVVYLLKDGFISGSLIPTVNTNNNRLPAVGLHHNTYSYAQERHNSKACVEGVWTENTRATQLRKAECTNSRDEYVRMRLGLCCLRSVDFCNYGKSTSCVTVEVPPTLYWGFIEKQVLLPPTACVGNFLILNYCSQAVAVGKYCTLTHISRMQMQSPYEE